MPHEPTSAWQARGRSLLLEKHSKWIFPEVGAIWSHENLPLRWHEHGHSGDHWSLVQVCGGCALQLWWVWRSHNIQVVFAKVVRQNACSLTTLITHNLTAEVSYDFMKASQVTKVIPTAVQGQTQGLVGAKLAVFCNFFVRDVCVISISIWLGVYNSTGNATTALHDEPRYRADYPSKLPLSWVGRQIFWYSWSLRGSWVGSPKEIHDLLVWRNTHQAQLWQKLKYGRAIRAKAYQPGELVWVHSAVRLT